jgi:glycosyltransferase involved in cell wall biosynthesis
MQMPDIKVDKQDKGILYIGGFELPDKNAAAQRVIANGKIFKELGFSVYYLGHDRTLKGNTLVSVPAEGSDNFTFYSSPYPSGLSKWISYLCGIKEILKIADEIPELEYIVAYNYPAIALNRLNRWSKSRNISLIADCTEWYEPQGNLLFKIIKGFDTSLRMKTVHPKLDGVIAISKYLYSFYNERMGNVLQLPPLVDAASDKWERNGSSSSDRLVLVYAGSPGKGAKDRIDAILGALCIIKVTSDIHFSLHVIGLTQQQYIEDFGAGSLPQDLDANVFFKGRLSHTDTLKEIKCADYAIFVRDSNLVNTAGFPTKFVEALSCGTPVLTNESSNIGDYLKNGENGYILDNSTSETLVQTLSVALSQKKEKINAMKTMIRTTNTFDYTNYIKPVEACLN